MGATLELQRCRINTLWVVDGEGDLLTSNEPNAKARRLDTEPRPYTWSGTRSVFCTPSGTTCHPTRDQRP
jgi:hypothetical protein